MKTITIILLSCFIICPIANSRTVDEISKLSETRQIRYRFPTELLNQVVLNMAYGNSFVISEYDRKQIKNADVQAIDVVFTDYPKNKDLTLLNKSRIKEIEKIRPDLVKNPTIKWRLIRQVACKTENEAKLMFHGIVIHFKPEQTEEITKMDLSYIYTNLPEKEPSIEKTKELLKNSKLAKVLDRNKQWKKMAVIADLTGSMSPYCQQLVLWFKLREKENRVKSVTFFNDGNRTPDIFKKSGNVGGIYYSTSCDYNSVRRLANKVISSGNGGDGQENDLEAVIETLKKCTKNHDIVLIADNLAPVRDMHLLKAIKQPIHIILCGTHFGVNIQYLEIARATGGSVHTMEKDLNDLIDKNEGDSFEIGGQLYQIRNGKIELKQRLVKT